MIYLSGQLVSRFDYERLIEILEGDQESDEF